jgi:uncharacterized protein YoxC
MKNISILIIGGIFLTLICIGCLLVTFYLIGTIRKQDAYLGRLRKTLESNNGMMLSLIKQIQDLINKMN